MCCLVYACACICFSLSILIALVLRYVMLSFFFLWFRPCVVCFVRFAVEYTCDEVEGLRDVRASFLPLTLPMTECAKRSNFGNLWSGNTRPPFAAHTSYSLCVVLLLISFTLRPTNRFPPVSYNEQPFILSFSLHITLHSPRLLIFSSLSHYDRSCLLSLPLLPPILLFVRFQFFVSFVCTSSKTAN